MKPRIYGVAGVISLAAATVISGCSSGGSVGATDSGSTQSSPKATAAIPSASGVGKTLSVWVMEGDYTDQTMAAINDEFTKQTGAKVKVTVQPWPNISTKVSTALASSSPPDVLDLAPAAPFGATGGLVDLTPYKADLEQGQTWVPGLLEAGSYKGTLYGVPGFATTRVVIYNKTMWNAAGITQPPTTFQELTQDLDAVKAKNPASDFSALYMPGKAWLLALPWVWDAGGDLFSFDNGTWKAGLSSAESQKGLAQYKDFQNKYSTVASRTATTDSPNMAQVFADGHAAAYIDNTGGLAKVLKANPKLTMDDLGTFPFPGESGQIQPSTLAGSQWAIAQKSNLKQLALTYLKIAGSPDIQSNDVFGVDGWIPNNLEAIKAAESSPKMTPQLKGFFDAAPRMRAPETAVHWATLEDDNSLNEFFGSVASGAKTPASAGKSIDAHIEQVLNAS